MNYKEVLTNILYHCLCESIRAPKAIMGFGRSPNMIEPSLPKRKIDTIVAIYIGVVAVLGTGIWGFGNL